MAREDDERLVDRLVTYTLEVEGPIVVIEHVPARVDDQTGERYFSPETVERIRHIVREGREPTRIFEAPVFDFAA